jgi:hypothetical protein
MTSSSPENSSSTGNEARQPVVGIGVIVLRIVPFAKCVKKPASLSKMRGWVV